jgi:uncharacterized protein (DUF1778 family)
VYDDETVEEAIDVADPARRKPPKDERLNIRATARQLELLQRAAEAQGLTLTDFVLTTATERAEQILVERRHFVADPESWDRFMEALERPPAPAPALVRLFRERRA